MPPPIAILGAGPSGLTLGRLLHLANIPFIIFEKDESENAATSGRGGTLDIHADSGQIALKEAGLLDQFKSIARYDAPVTIADALGKVYLKVEEQGDDNEKPEIDRKDLRTLLLSSIPTSNVRWNSKVHRVEKETDGLMSVHFTDGSTEGGFKLVVGADGAWSKARSLVTSARPQYSGIYYLTTALRPENPFHSSVASMAGNGLYMALGNGKQIVVARLGDNSYYIAFGLPLLESWSKEQIDLVKDSAALRKWLLGKDGFSDWPKIHTDLIRHSDEDFYAWPLYAMPTESLSWKTVPGVTLVGDAAHLTTPFVGEGVNCALYDSLQLAKQIIKHGLNDLDGAVAEYEAEMLPRGIDLIERSTKSGELYFAPDAPKGWLKTFAGIDME